MMQRKKGQGVLLRVIKGAKVPAATSATSAVESSGALKSIGGIGRWWWACFRDSAVRFSCLKTSGQTDERVKEHSRSTFNTAKKSGGDKGLTPRQAAQIGREPMLKIVTE
eukprot:1048446-Pelagomonas_calceolata.AAC.1